MIINQVDQKELLGFIKSTNKSTGSQETVQFIFNGNITQDHLREFEDSYKALKGMGRL
jgi:hypothetical protein